MLNKLSISSQFLEIVSKLKQSTPLYFLYYIVIYLLASYLLFVFYIPGNDYDTMCSYIARIKLEDFGSLKDVATLEIQYLFPKFFDYLHAPLLKLGYFLTLPNFFLFLTLIFVLLRISSPPVCFFTIILIFSCQPLLLGSTSLKNDMSLGILAFLGWYIIFYYRNNTWFLTLSTLMVAALIGTKYHGFLLAFLLLFPLIYIIYKEQLLTQKSLILWFFFFPVFFWVSSAKVYIDNWLNYGSIMPRPDYLSPVDVSIFTNIYKFIVVNLLQTFDIPAYLSDVYAHSSILAWEKQISLIAKEDLAILRPASNINAFGAIIIVVIILDICVIINSKYSFATKTLALIAIVYLLALLTQFSYSNWISRYFLPTYILSISPAAEALNQFPFKTWFSKLWVKRLLIIYAILVSLHCFLFTAEKNLLGLRVVDLNTGIASHYSSIWSKFTDRDALYFHSQDGYFEIYEYFRKNIFLSDSLLIINNATGNDSPFIYPFIKNRQAANTNVFNTRYGGSYESLLGNYQYIMIYKGTVKSPDYKEVFNYNKGETIIYKIIK